MPPNRMTLARELQQLSQEIKNLQDALPSMSAAEVDALHGRTSSFLDETRRAAVAAAEEPFEMPGLGRSFPTEEVSAEELRAADARWAGMVEAGERTRVGAIRRVGPFLQPAQVARLLGLTTETVRAWRRERRLLAVPRDRRGEHYPVWQFSGGRAPGEGRVLPGLDAVLRAMHRLPAWNQAELLLTPTPTLGGRPALDVLRDGEPDGLRRVIDWVARAGELGS